jgi:hypothetical protein
MLVISQTALRAGLAELSSSQASAFTITMRWTAGIFGLVLRNIGMEAFLFVLIGLYMNF